MHTHKFDPSELVKLENPERYKWLHPSKVADLFSLSGGETLAEYGCGTGFYTLELARRAPRGRVLALDISTELLDFLSRKLSALSGEGPALATPAGTTFDAGAGGAPRNIELVLVEGVPAPVESGSIDGILAINLLHELEGEWEVLGDMHRILKPDGRLIVLDWIAMERPAGPPMDHCLDPARALGLLDEAGFNLLERPETAKSDFPYHFTYIMGKK